MKLSETASGIVRIGTDSARVGTEYDSRSRLFGHPDAHQDFPPLTQFSTFGYESQATKVHVCTRNDSNEFLARADQVVAHNVSFETGKGESSSRFRYRARFFLRTPISISLSIANDAQSPLTLKDVLDRSTNFIVVDEGDFVQGVFANPETLLPNDLDGGAIAERSDFTEYHSLSGSDTPFHRITIDSLDSDHFEAFGSDPLDIGGHSGDQTATTDASKDTVELLKLLHLSRQLDCNSSLAGDDERIVVRGNEV